MKTLCQIVCLIMLPALLHAADYSGTATGPELDYVHGVTGPVQTQLNKQQSHFQTYSGNRQAEINGKLPATGQALDSAKLGGNLAGYYLNQATGNSGDVTWAWNSGLSSMVYTMAAFGTAGSYGFGVYQFDTKGRFQNFVSRVPTFGHISSLAMSGGSGIAGSLPWKNISSAVLSHPMNVPTGSVSSASSNAFPTDQQVSQWSVGYSNWSTSLRANKSAVAATIGVSGGGGTTNTTWINGYGPILTDSIGAQWLLGVTTSGTLTTSLVFNPILFTDSFTGSTGSINASNWTVVTGTSMPQLTGSGAVKGNGTSDSWALYTAQTAPANQWAELDGITYTGGYVNGLAGVIVRGSTSGTSGYEGHITGNGSGVVNAIVYRYGGSNPGSIYSGSTISPGNTYTKIKLDVQGAGTSTNLTFTGWNGSSWVNFYTGADTSGYAFNSGQPGVRMLDSGVSWTAGPFSTGTP